MPPRVRSGTAPDALVVTAAGDLAWSIAAVVLTAVGLAIAARRRGRFAAACRRVLAAYPRPLRHWAVAIAAGVAVTASSAAPAMAAPASSAASAQHGHGAVLRRAAGPLAWPSTSTGTVVVRPGDCLWSVAQRWLGRSASATAVAAAWPQWWAANRDVIGPDPALLHPGERLRTPLPVNERTPA